MDKWEVPLSSLYEATAALERVDPEDLPAVEAILERRLTALRDIHSLSQHATDLAGCLMPAFESGRKFEQRLRLLRASLQHRLAENHTAVILLRAFAAPEFQNEPALEVKG
jgi:hypothetical protein